MWSEHQDLESLKLELFLTKDIIYSINISLILTFMLKQKVKGELYVVKIR